MTQRTITHAFIQYKAYLQMTKRQHHEWNNGSETYSGKAIQKKWVLRWDLKMERVGKFLRSEGRLFQTEGARYWKER